MGTIAAGAINTVLPPVFGALSDRVGRARVTTDEQMGRGLGILGRALHAA